MKSRERFFHVLMILLGLFVLGVSASGQSAQKQGPRLQTLVVSYHLQRSWGAGPDVTSSILFQTDALSLTEAELEPIPPDRLYNDLVGALAKEGTTVRAGKDTLTILGWSTPNRRDIVLKTPKPQKPKQ